MHIYISSLSDPSPFCLPCIEPISAHNHHSVISCEVCSGLPSPDGRCRTFDEAAGGYGRGEGSVAVVLSRGTDGLLTVDAGALNQDGRSASLTAPRAASQQAVARAFFFGGGREVLLPSGHKLFLKKNMVSEKKFRM